jgi:arabinosaccharide transport system substrate-binding protein
VGPTLRRRTLLRSVVALATATALGVLAGACASGTAPTGTTGQIRLEEWNFGTSRVWWQQDALKIYQKTHPEVDIHWVTLPYGQMHEKLLMTVLAGTGSPDIADLEISAFSRFLKQKQPGFVPLNGRLQAANAMNSLFGPSATDPWSWRDQIYALGNELNVCLWCYNWQILQQFNVNLPVTTWDEFARAGQEVFKASNGKTVLMDFMDLEWGDWWIRALDGGSGVFDREGRPTLTDQASVESLQYAYDAVHRDKWSMTSPFGNSYYAALQSRNVASLLGPPWRFSGALNQNLPATSGWWNVQLLPSWTPNRAGAATLGGTGVCAMRGGKYPEQAADFVVWEHTTPEAVLADFDHRQVWPTLKTAWSAPRLTQPIPFFNNQDVGSLIERAAPLIPKWYNSPYWAEVTDALVRLGITPALHNQAAPAQALRSVQDNSLYLMSVESAAGTT